MTFIGYIFCLTLTIILELLLYKLLRRRNDKYIDLCLMNVFTNSLAQLFLSLTIYYPYDNTYPSANAAYFFIFILETFVILAEWAMLIYMEVKKPLATSIYLNLFSFILGLFIMGSL